MPDHSHPEIERSIGRLEGKVETGLDSLGKSIDLVRDTQVNGFRELKQGMHEITVANGKQNKQIGTLKGKHQWLLGGIAAIVFLTPLVIMLISYFT
jgi:hypothetical protein